MSRLRIGLVAALFGGLTGAFGLFGLAQYILLTPALGPQHAMDPPHELLVQRGDTLRTVLHSLHRQGVLPMPDLLYLVARLTGRTAVRGGCYRFDAQKTPQQLMAMLYEGQVALESFTLAEGLNRWQVRDLLVAGRWMAPAQFDALCDSPRFLAAHKIPGPSCEGYLFPETYKVTRGLPAETLFGMMFANYHRELAAILTAHGRGPRQLADREFTTLASIVEKETGDPQERSRIACVFYNRLQGLPAWRLETDPTVIYAAHLADSHFDGNLTRAHLRHLDSPYNTYRVYGLPPGPIASPGRAALSAVAQPSTCADYFFVSTNHGRHVFCPSLACHNKAVKRWQVDYFRRRAPGLRVRAPSAGARATSALRPPRRLRSPSPAPP
jgi:UPF0755 protein